MSNPPDGETGRGEPARVGEAIAGFLRERRWQERLADAAVFGRWEELVGPELARRCEPVRLAGGRLVVRAESPAWATEVSYLAGRIRTRADELLGPGRVREVEVTVGRLGGGAAGPDATRSHDPRSSP